MKEKLNAIDNVVKISMRNNSSKGKKEIDRLFSLNDERKLSPDLDFPSLFGMNDDETRGISELKHDRRRPILCDYITRAVVNS